jgi:hypothetical protein
MRGDDVTVESTADKANRGNRPGRRDKTTSCRRSGGLAVLAAAAAIGLAACGGGLKTPHVASLGTTTSLGTSLANSGGGTPTGGTSDGSSATTVAKGNPTALLDQWATCMHSYGDANQADPTVDAYGVIHITIPTDAQDLSNEVHAGADPCNQYIAAAQSALRAANPVAPPPDQAELLKYVGCMRANGVPNYPYPTGNTTNFNGTGVDPNSPQVENVSKLCGEKLTLPGWWISGNGPPGDVEVSSGGPNGGPPPEAAGANGGAGPTPVPVTGG